MQQDRPTTLAHHQGQAEAAESNKEKAVCVGQPINLLKMWQQARGALKERKGKFVTRAIQGDDQQPYPGMQVIALELEGKTNEQKLEASLRAQPWYP